MGLIRRLLTKSYEKTSILPRPYLLQDSAGETVQGAQHVLGRPRLQAGVSGQEWCVADGDHPEQRPDSSLRRHPLVINKEDLGYQS